MKAILLLIGFLLSSALLVAPPLSAVASAAGSASAHESAEALYRRALDLLARNTVDTRRQALRALEEATLLDPGNATYELALARANYASGFLRTARQHFEKVVRLQPEGAAGHLGLGLVWRRDWLKYLDHASLDLAVEQLSLSAALDSTNVGTWLALSPLLIEQGRLADASRAAFRAAMNDPSRPDGLLAVAAVLEREGLLHDADSLFRAAIPRLRRNVRERFEDISPLATERDTFELHHLPAAEQPAFVARFWKGIDPDLSTPENEAQLEYWARVTQAYFLFFDTARDAWDERGEMYVRYGPPAQMEYNPVAAGSTSAFGSEFPANFLVWTYPELGLQVTMQDRLLSEFYLPPLSSTADMDTTPNPDSLARAAGLIATAGGRGVFHLLPPGVQPLAVDGQLTRFESDSAPRLLALLEAPGGPTDSLWAEWVVLDSARAEAARGAGALAPSACAAATRRTGDFSASLAPGSYLVSMTVRDQSGRRGIIRRQVALAAPRRTLELSDVVLSCSLPGAGDQGVVRIDPNPGGYVTGAGPLTAYFEIYHLTPGADGLSRFEYVYAVRSAAKDTRFWLAKLLAPLPDPALAVSRQDQNPGSLRRQYITVPVASLAPGRYRLEITVRDLATGAAAARQLEFTKGS